jgi:hypothetical protein
MASPQTIQPATADNYLNKATPTTNLGTDVNLGIDPSASYAVHSLLKFDFSAVVPAGQNITLATLSLNSWLYVTGRTLSCYRLRRTDWEVSQSTWNIFKTANNWSTAGALDTTNDYDTTNTATAAAKAGWVAWTVTAQVQSALDTYSGIAHFFLRDAGAPTDSATQLFYSSDYATDTALRPKLYIEYAPPSALKTVNGLAKVSVKTRNGLAIGTVKTWNGLS